MLSFKKLCLSLLLAVLLAAQVAPAALAASSLSSGTADEADCSDKPLEDAGLYELDYNKYADVQTNPDFTGDDSLASPFQLVINDMTTATIGTLGANPEAGQAWVIVEGLEEIHLKAYGDIQFDLSASEWAVVIYPQSDVHKTSDVFRLFPWDGGRIWVTADPADVFTYLQHLHLCKDGTAGTFLLGADQLPPSEFLKIWYYFPPWHLEENNVLRMTSE